MRSASSQSFAAVALAAMLGFIGEFKWVNDFKERRNVLHAGFADFARETGGIEQSALVGPTQCESL